MDDGRFPLRASEPIFPVADVVATVGCSGLERIYGMSLTIEGRRGPEQDGAMEEAR
jgi:hypothetical protein